MARVIVILIAMLAARAFGRNNLARTPPMGWMSWQVFRCNLNTSTDDCTDPATTGCISQALYEGQADAMVANGFAASGYASIHMDDCWEQQAPPRDPVTNQLRADFVRFPAGMKALGDYIHQKGLGFAIYTAESTETCGGYPASQGYEVLDAQTFATWGVGELIPRYACAVFPVIHTPSKLQTTSRWTAVAVRSRAGKLKSDVWIVPRRPISPLQIRHTTRPATRRWEQHSKLQGATSLTRALGQPILVRRSVVHVVLSGYLAAWIVLCCVADTAGDNETQKPFGTFVMDGCNLWRNW